MVGFLHNQVVFHGGGVSIPLHANSIQGFIEEFVGPGRGMEEVVWD